eukprot:m.14392 g.14392  ORF g.14392 m.14392 type:complete len:88 (+) comp4300_c0_seq1:37-300(+)
MIITLSYRLILDHFWFLVAVRDRRDVGTCGSLFKDGWDDGLYWQLCHYSYCQPLCVPRAIDDANFESKRGYCAFGSNIATTREFEKG